MRKTCWRCPELLTPSLLLSAFETQAFSCLEQRVDCYSYHASPPRWAGQVPTLTVVTHFDELSTCNKGTSLRLTQQRFKNPSAAREKLHLWFRTAVVWCTLSFITLFNCSRWRILSMNRLTICNMKEISVLQTSRQKATSCWTVVEHLEAKEPDVSLWSLVEQTELRVWIMYTNTAHAEC